jgi:hypothetical protein
MIGRTPPFRALCAFSLAIAIASLACKKSDETGVQVGELGRGTFVYICGSGADAQCNDNADLSIVDPSTNLPSVALGSTFNVNYRSNGDKSTTGPTQSGDLDFLSVDTASTGYDAKRVGLVALLGIYHGRVEDLVHAHIEALDHLEFANTNPSGGGSFKGEVTVPGLNVDASATAAPTMLVRVVPMTKDRRLLAGALPCQWTTSDATTAAIDGASTGNIVSVKLLKSGTATLHVTLGPLAGDVTLTIKT